MGSYFHKEYTPFQQFFNGKKLKAIVLGLDAAGKTTLLYRLNIGEVVYSIPTIGMCMQTVEFQKVKLICWDVGGGSRMRRLYQHFYHDINAIIFVVDLSDKERLEEARTQLEILLSQDALKDAALLVFANKSDRQVMKSQEMAQKMGLSDLKGRNWRVQACCAMEGGGLLEGFQWLCYAVSQKK